MKEPDGKFVPTVNLEDAVVYLRELLAMNKTELAREANFAHQVRCPLKRPEMVIFAFERKFNSSAKDPTIARRNKVPFSPTF